MANKIIDIQNLVKDYKSVRAVDGVTFDVLEGELFALLGVNGAGKSTVIKILTSLIAPTDGKAALFGKDLHSLSSSDKNSISVSPQETSVANNLTVKENLEFFHDVFINDKSSRAQAVQSIVDKFDLKNVLNRRAGRLSGGQKRKLSIALAIITNPKIIFLDEPTLGLDVISRRETWKIIKELKGKVTIILTTHYLEEAEALSDRCGIMANGKLLALGTVSDIKSIAETDNFEDAFVKIVTGENL